MAGDPRLWRNSLITSKMCLDADAYLPESSNYYLVSHPFVWAFLPFPLGHQSAAVLQHIGSGICIAIVSLNEGSLDFMQYSNIKRQGSLMSKGQDKIPTAIFFPSSSSSSLLANQGAASVPRRPKRALTAYGMETPGGPLSQDHWVQAVSY